MWGWNYPIESKLLGRKCIAVDINDKAIELAKRNLNFDLNNLFKEVYEPVLLVVDARNLSFLKDNSIDLICSHPPYANITHYTNKKDKDLSFYDINEFLIEMEKVAKESFRVLKPGKKCAILIGDLRRQKNVVPLGFKLIDVYLKAGFRLKELVIKRQHNCKTTGFWYSNSIKYNFLLLAHEYLPIFEKPIKNNIDKSKAIEQLKEMNLELEYFVSEKKTKQLESTTVWIFPENSYDELLNNNIIERYGNGQECEIINITSSSAQNFSSARDRKKKLLFIKSTILNDINIPNFDEKIYLDKILYVLKKETPSIEAGGYFVVQTKDIRSNGYVKPLAKYLFDIINFSDFLLKEIVIVTKEKNSCLVHDDEYLEIVHDYLLIYKKKK